MRILLSIHHALDPNLGAPGATLALGEEYVERGHDVSYLSFDDLPRQLPPRAKELLYPEFAAWHMTRRARGGLDVIDASTGDAWLWARTLRRGRARPLLVARGHGLEHRFWEAEVREAGTTGRRMARRTALYHGGLRLREVGASLRLADRCVFLNRDDLEYAVQRLGVPRERAALMPNGISADFLGRPVPPIGDGPVGIAHVGSWAVRKGVRYVASALARVVEAREDVRLGFFGVDVPPERVLAELPAAARERTRVVPRYDHENLPNLLESHQVLASASLAEGFSLALPEAMACGLAPVATAISGAREIVRDGENGILVRPRDPDAMAAAVLRLAADRVLLERLRAAAHETAQSLSWARIADETIALYERGLAVLPRSAR
jgi:glycosyltransferase involved in cell wall biosynthesis